MTELEAALIEVVGAIEECGLPYVVIGGLAVALAGEPRATLDVDVSCWVHPARLEEAIGRLSVALNPLPVDPQTFVRERRVLPVKTKLGVRADIVFAMLPTEREIIRRGIPREVAGKIVKSASVEDIILMKLISEREKDLADARALLKRFGKSLDRAYLLPQLEELAEALARPDILAMFNSSS